MTVDTAQFHIAFGVQHQQPHSAPTQVQLQPVVPPVTPQSPALCNSTTRTQKKILINYAHNCCQHSQRRSCESGLLVGGFDECRNYSIGDIDSDFYQRNIGTFCGLPKVFLWREQLD
jgi:hypothetical protein